MRKVGLTWGKPLETGRSDECDTSKIINTPTPYRIIYPMESIMQVCRGIVLLASWKSGEENFQWLGW